MTQYIAVATQDDNNLWQDHFGIAPQWKLYNHEGDFVETRTNPHSAEADNAPEHSSPQAVQDLLGDCDVFIAKLTGHYEAQMTKTGVQVIITEANTPEEAVQQFLAN
jgi:predicted Fe-Mo cluster-binding NifX family protein